MFKHAVRYGTVNMQYSKHAVQYGTVNKLRLGYKECKWCSPWPSTQVLNNSFAILKASYGFTVNVSFYLLQQDSVA
jgi:hypothetical protein